MSDTVEQTLVKRDGKYGEYEVAASLTQQIKDVMRSGPNWGNMPHYMAESLDQLASKIGRILNGDIYYVDSWHDAAGYMTLVEQCIRNTQHWINVEEYWETECLHTNTWADQPYRTVCSDCGLVLSED